MTAELVAFGAVVGSFALSVTLAVAQAFGLARLGQRGWALVALLVPPLGAALAYRAGLRARAVAFLVAAATYGVARLLTR